MKMGHLAWGWADPEKAIQFVAMEPLSEGFGVSYIRDKTIINFD